ncbi:aspartate-semialdehyde dehydrogenase [Gonapodya prolifera JEL478]|uniref:Aspartate-semialdehyde dehydrogenase n=1 Tax=Gonapodya prolifera (strain JEL478) TaxID=1344416 RepID=A0A139AQ44_GONPJ|nr:aspartate-semialdehyde dehydrogenase [Gonapodya prolifera JEL478]|eukprot:KXS18856.1 aspartate-semialdehyde dehydrogenase [Gonapodya prolifera JEL478]
MSSPTQHKIHVGVLGATGTVGQRFIQLLDNHPYFHLAALGASESSAGKSYKDAVRRRWKMTTPIPADVAALPVTLCAPEHFASCRVIFSGLDSSVAGDVERAFFTAGFAVFSNARNYRMDPDVPLIVPTVNPDHFDIIPHQRSARSLGRGFIVTNANCSTTGLVVPLKALQDAFGPIDSMFVHTLQAISGAGYPGIASLDICDNVVPYISGEEDKLEIEPCKILGSLSPAKSDHVFTTTRISATCNRVNVVDGHLENVSLSFVNRPPPSLDAIARALSAYTCEATQLGVPSAPLHPIEVTDEEDRPQPRLDRERGKGMTVTVGRIRKDPVLDVRFSLLSHNTILGAAGSSLMNAEIAFKKGLLA